MQNFKFGGFNVLSVQLFNKIKRKEKEKKKKNMKKTGFAIYIFRMLCRNTFIFGELIFCFRH